MKLLMAVITIMLFTGCNEMFTPPPILDLDSLNRAWYMDTANIKTSPVGIVSYSLSGSGTNKSINLVYHNLTSKKIRFVEFSWYYLGAKGKSADKGMSHDGISYGHDLRNVDSGQYMNISYATGSTMISKLVAVWPSEVGFEDGSRWYVRRQKEPGLPDSK